jgi:uncharacterized protein YunC (DUF1805 family)
MPNYLLSSGEVIEYPTPAPHVAAFIGRVKAAAESPDAKPAALLALVYGTENPILDVTSQPGYAMIGAKQLADPLYHVLADMVFRAQLRAVGQTAEDVYATYTVSVAEAAEQLGITVASVRAAITARKLAAVMRNGQWYLRPESVASYKVSNRGRKKAAVEPATADVQVRCGSAEGGSLSVRIVGGELKVDAKKGDAVLAHFPAGWSRALLKATTKQGVRVFELEPAPGESGEVEHLGLYARGPFRVVKTHTATRTANAVWKAAA